MFKGVCAGVELTLINRKETYDLWWGDIEKQMPLLMIKCLMVCR